MSLSQSKKLGHAFVKDELMLKATDGMKTGSRVPRKEPPLISIEKPFKAEMGKKMVEMAALKGRDLRMVSWSQELIDIVHKLEEIEAEDGSASNIKEREDLEKICVMIFNHTEAHMKVVMEKLEAV